MVASLSNCLICSTNYADVNSFYSPVLSGGSWSPDAPLSNLQNPVLAYKSRTINCVPFDTHFIIDFGTLRSLMAIVVLGHNLSQLATYTVNVYSSISMVGDNIDTTSPNTVLSGTYSGTISPVVYPFGSIPFEDPHWANGQYTSEEFSNYKVPVISLFNPAIVGRYADVLFNDPYNPNLYLEFSRLFASPGYQPFFNMQVGAQLIPVDPSPILTTLGGYRSVDPRPKYREFNLTIPVLPNSEAFSQVFDSQYANGKTNQIFFSADPTDSFNLHRKSFLCNLSQLSPITMSFNNFSGVAYNLIEVVA